ncbi:MAG: rRNA maturation RNase YbeY [Clostridiales bacterium]|jgi:probable rRNA maturation factor|nr:rRNA maturation RNase YbeY [Clostridiales bacterium]
MIQLVDIDIQTQGLEIDTCLVKSAILATLRHCGADFPGEVSVLAVQDAEMSRYNQQYRGKDATTDVLSFPQYFKEEIANAPTEYVCLGDIIINISAARRQAEEYGHSIQREIAFLAVHGALHLLGFDHHDEAAEARMFAVQEEILTEMGLER